MKDKRYDFLQALFDEGDLVAFGKDNASSNKPIDPIPNFLYTNAEKFCINPLKEWRNTDNVTHINSLLFEWDDKEVTPKQQMERFNACGIPYTTMVYSGGKSVHVIVRFTEPIENKAWQESWWNAIAKGLNSFGIIADVKARLIVQLSRVPESVRENTGLKQTLITIKERVSVAQMKEWLSKLNIEVKEPIEHPPIIYNEGANDKVSNMRKFKLATNWTQKKHGVYSSYMRTGGYMWLFSLGVNAYKLDMSFEAAASFAQIEWGHEFSGHNGNGKVADAINKGWTYGYKSRIEKVELR